MKGGHMVKSKKSTKSLHPTLYPAKLLLFSLGTTLRNQTSPLTHDYSTQPNLYSSSHVTSLPNQTSPLLIMWLLYPTKLFVLFPHDYSTQPNFSSFSHMTTLPSQTSPLLPTWLLYPTKLLLFFPRDYSTQPNFSSSAHVGWREKLVKKSR